MLQPMTSPNIFLSTLQTLNQGSLYFCSCRNPIAKPIGKLLEKWVSPFCILESRTLGVLCKTGSCTINNFGTLPVQVNGCLKICQFGSSSGTKKQSGNCFSCFGPDQIHFMQKGVSQPVVLVPSVVPDGSHGTPASWQQDQKHDSTNSRSFDSVGRAPKHGFLHLKNLSHLH